MMLFKLSLRNLSHSIRDYAVYFITLILGVMVFYLFNALDSQSVLAMVGSSSYEIIHQMMAFLYLMSFFVAFIMGFLVIYASRFLIRRRKREFSIYLLLGMSKKKISRMLLCETLLIGLLSLVIGLLLGIAMSQLMSIIVARMFEADMSAYVFSVSPFALQLTIFCFGFMYFMVILFHMFTIRSSSLNAMLRSQDKSETTRPKNLWLCLIVFLIGAVMLGYAYYRVSVDVAGLEVVTLMRMIVYGIIATFLLFWSLSGFVLRIAMWRRSFYYRGLNSFTLREFYTRINTTVSAMSTICILLFFTICIFASAMSLNSTFRDDLERRVPRDVQVISRESEEEVSALLSVAGFDLSGLRAVDEGPTYEAQELTLSDTLGGRLEETMSQWYAMINFDATETIMEQSDYNRVAKIYGDEQISLAADEYAVSCSMDIWKEIRTEALAMQTQIEVNGRKLKPAVQQCLDGQLEMNGMVINLGIIIVPDGLMREDQVASNWLFADYRAADAESRSEIETSLQEASTRCPAAMTVNLRSVIYSDNTGLGVMITFIGLYISIVFLICSAAILALKQLASCSDSRPRYALLRSLGVSEREISRSLFVQTLLFFGAPLALACFHSLFGLPFCSKLLLSFGGGDMSGALLPTGLLLIVVYGGYFLVTYLCSRSMIREQRVHQE